MMRFKNILCLFFLGILGSSCLSDEAIQLPFQSYAPKQLGDGLQISSPQAEGVDSDILTQVYQELRSNPDFWSMRSLLIFRNNRLISEDYLMDSLDISQPHLIWSCTKQVLAIIAGIAVDSGYIHNINDPISAYFDSELETHPDKASISIQQLLTMRSDIDYQNGGAGGHTDQILRQFPDNSLDFILSQPLKSSQNTEFHYNDGNPHIISALLQKRIGQPVDSWADAVFFSKIGFSNYNWLRYRDGITLGAFGIETTPRELAKIALCVADRGHYNGQQILNPNWIDEMLAPKVDTDEAGYKMGYYWWIEPIRDIYFMWGHGGQYAFIIPSKSLVIVSTAIPNTDGHFQIDADELLPILDKIITACH